MGIAPDQIKKLAELNITDYGSLIAAPDNLNSQIGEILKYDADQVSGLRNQASTQMEAIKAKQETEPQAEPESSAAAPPMAESYQQPPAPKSARSEYLDQAASFLGKPREELEKLDQVAIDTMMNDRMSLYNQKQMGGGESDQALRHFSRYDMGENSLDAVAERTVSVTDRRQAIRIDQPLATQRAPVAVSNRTGIDMKQIAGMVQQMIGDMEPRFASRIYRQLEQSLYA